MVLQNIVFCCVKMRTRRGDILKCGDSGLHVHFVVHIKRAEEDTDNQSLKEFPR